MKVHIVISGIDFACHHSGHSVFVHRAKYDSVILAVYVDDILLTGSDSVALAETKKYLNCYFVTKDMWKSKYFLGIEVAFKKHGLLLSIFDYSDSGYGGNKGDRKSTTGYCTFLGGNLVTWRNKKTRCI